MEDLSAKATRGLHCSVTVRDTRFSVLTGSPTSPIVPIDRARLRPVEERPGCLSPGRGSASDRKRRVRLHIRHLQMANPAWGASIGNLEQSEDAVPRCGQRYARCDCFGEGAPVVLRPHLQPMAWGVARSPLARHVSRGHRYPIPTGVRIIKRFLRAAALTTVPLSR